MDEEEYNNNETLVLRNVGKNMAGDFRCRVVNEFGAEFSEPATLIVLGKCLYTFTETLLRICLFICSGLAPEKELSSSVNVLCMSQIFSILAVKKFCFIYFTYELFFNESTR